MRGAFLIAVLIALLIVGLLTVKRQQATLRVPSQAAERIPSRNIRATTEAIHQEIEAINKAANEATEEALKDPKD